MAGRVTDEGRGGVRLTGSIATDTALARRDSDPNPAFSFGRSG